VLYNLYIETGDPGYAACAALFDKPNFFEPLVAGQDTLPGRHANTHLAQVNGFGARFEATGDADAAAAVENFFALALRVSYTCSHAIAVGRTRCALCSVRRRCLQHHTFSTGGSNWWERWHAQDSLGDAVTDVSGGTLSRGRCIPVMQDYGNRCSSSS
jgi:hypothetical protein